MSTAFEHPVHFIKTDDVANQQALNLKLRGEETAHSTPSISRILIGANENVSTLSGRDVAKQAAVDAFCFGSLTALTRPGVQHFAPGSIRPSAFRTVGTLVGMSALVGVGLGLASDDSRPTNEFNDGIKKVVATGLTTAAVGSENWRVRAVFGVGGMALQAGANALSRYLSSDENDRNLDRLKKQNT